MGFNIGDNVIFINNNPTFHSHNILRGKIGIIVDISRERIMEDQSICVNWPISGMNHWWTFDTDMRLAKPEELS